MTTRVRWKLHNAGFTALRNSPEVIADLEKRAERIASAAGDGMETRPAETGRGRHGRARVAVVTATSDARRRQAKDSALTRSVDAGR